MESVSSWLPRSGSRILVDFVVAAAAGAGFLVWELRTPTPMLNLKLLKLRTFAGAAVVAFIFGAGIYGSTYLMPLFVQTIQGYTPTRSGLLLLLMVTGHPRMPPVGRSRGRPSARRRASHIQSKGDER